MTTLAFALRTRTFRSLRRHRNYRIFFTGQLVSLAGSWMQNVALAWLVLELSGSPLAVGVLAFWRFLPVHVFGLVAGVIADRVDSRRLVMATQAAAMVVSVAPRGRHADGHRDACRSSTCSPRSAASPWRSTRRAVSRSRSRWSARASCRTRSRSTRGSSTRSRVIGPAIAGLVIAAAGTGVCFVLNAFSFLAVLTALAMPAGGRARTRSSAIPRRGSSTACAGRRASCWHDRAAAALVSASSRS